MIKQNATIIRFMHEIIFLLYLGRNSDDKEPLLGSISPVVYDLTSGQVGVSVKHLLWLGITYYQCNCKIEFR